MDFSFLCLCPGGSFETKRIFLGILSQRFKILRNNSLFFLVQQSSDQQKVK